MATNKLNDGSRLPLVTHVRCKRRKSSFSLNSQRNSTASDEMNNFDEAIDAYPVYLDLASETSQTETDTGDEASMGGKNSKRKNKRFSAPVQLNDANEPNRTAQLRNKHLSSALKPSASLSRPISMPPCDPPSPPLAGVVSSPSHQGGFGQRPLPPRPRESQESAEPHYSNIEVNLQSLDRKSSMPTDPPPLPPVASDASPYEEVIDSPRRKPQKIPRPPTYPGESPPLFKTDFRSAVHVKKSESISNPEKDPSNFTTKESQIGHPFNVHPIAKMLKAWQNFTKLQRLAASCTDSASGEKLNKISVKSILSYSNENETKTVGQSVVSKPVSHLHKTSSGPNIAKVPKAVVSPGYRPSVAAKPLLVPKKPTLSTSSASDKYQKESDSNGNSSISKFFRHDSASDSRPCWVQNKPTLPTPYDKPAQFSNPNLSTCEDSSNQMQSERVKSCLTSSELDDAKEIPDADKMTLNVPYKRRVDKSGYTLHKLLAERLESQQKGSNQESPSCSDSVFIEQNVDDSNCLNLKATNNNKETNACHVIADKGVARSTRTANVYVGTQFPSPKKLSAVTSSESSFISDKKLSRKDSQNLLATSSCPPKSPNIKPKQRPTVPPPPRPSGKPQRPQNEKKRPPTRPPPPTKQKILEARLKRQLSCKKTSMPASIHSSPKYAGISSRNSETSFRKEIRSQGPSSSGSDEEVYYSSIADLTQETEKVTIDFRSKQSVKTVQQKPGNSSIKKDKLVSTATAESKMQTSVKQLGVDLQNDTESTTALSPQKSDYLGIYVRIDDFPEQRNENEYLASVSAFQERR